MKLYRVVRCRKCKEDDFLVYEEFVSCSGCGKLYLRPKPDWPFDISYDTMRTEKEKETDKPIS